MNRGKAIKQKPLRKVIAKTISRVGTTSRDKDGTVKSFNVGVGKVPKRFAVYGGNYPDRVEAGFLTPLGGYHGEVKKKKKK